MAKRGTIAERFERHYRPHRSGCWLWTGSINSNGYAQMAAGKTGDPPLRGHVVAYKLFKGKVPKGLDVMHSCDVRHCVNPDHLSIGTRKKNMEDCEAKGRIARGFMLPHTRLTDAEIRAIRRDPRLQRIIALDYDICSSYVSMIKKRDRRRILCGS